MRRSLLAVSLLCLAVGSAGGVIAERGMVASEHRLASEAGVRILRQGGNAVDAAVATAFALGVVNPSSCGIGGGGFMLVFERRSGKVAALDYRESAPAAARRDMFRDGGSSVRGGLAVATPGEIAGIVAALERFGTLPLATLAEPAIAYARDGFPIEAHLARTIAAGRDRIRESPRLAALLLHPDGTPLGKGETLRQPDLARTLEAVAHGGRRAFYEGPVAEAIAAAAREAGGVLTAADLARYRPVWRKSLSGRFGVHDIHGMPPPSSGGGALMTILRIVQRDDLAALGRNTPTTLHLLAEAMQFAFADRAELYGDPDFVSVPLGQLLSPERAFRLRRRLSAATTFSPEFYGHGSGAAGGGTSHLSVIDEDGNAVACTTSINTAFGSHVIAGGTGILLNNTMDDFSTAPGVANVYGLVGSEANAVAPGKRPLSSMTPTIVIREGEAVTVAGGSGGPFIISGTLQALLGVLAFGQDAEAAVNAPRLHHQWVPNALLLEPEFPELTHLALRRRGHRTAEASPIGAVQLIRRQADGRLDGAADPRKGGAAIGW
jgi:gamma-glutamyltranspeptidase/glutathione hydrolase